MVGTLYVVLNLAVLLFAFGLLRFTASLPYLASFASVAVFGTTLLLLGNTLPVRRV